MLNRFTLSLSALMPRAFLLAGSLLAAAPLNAELITEIDIGAEIPLLRGVSLLSQQRAQAPAAITILDRAFIEAAPATSLTDLFRLVPGFQSYLAAAGEGRVNYHVMADAYPRRMEIKVDGRSVYESIFTTVIWSSLGLQLQDIERIEIVRGTNAATEGSNAFIGSINIVTRSPLNSSGVSVTARNGSDGIGVLAGSQSGEVGDISYRVAASYQREDGFADIEEGMDDAMEAKSVDLRAVWMPTAWDTLDLHVGLSDDRVGSGGDDEYATYNYRGSYQKVSWQRVLGSGDEFELQLYHNQLKTGSEAPRRNFSDLLGELYGLDGPMPLPFPAPFGSFSDQALLVDFESTQSDRWELNGNRSLRLSRSLRAAVGAALRHDSGRSPLLFGDGKTIKRSSGRLFGHLEWQPRSDWTFNAGATFEKPSGEDFFGSGRLGVNYRQANGAVWRATASHGERLGSILESNQQLMLRYDDLVLDAVVVTGDDLATEKIDAYEIGYSRSWWQQRLQLDLRGFRERYRDMIGSRREPYAGELHPDQWVGVRRNNTNLLLKGYELELGLRMGRRWLASFTATNLDLTGYTHKYLSQPHSYFQPQNDRSPDDSRSLLVSYQSDSGWQLSLASAYQSRLKWTDGNAVESHLRTDLKAARKWSLGGGELKVSLTAQNIGEDYAEFYLTNQFQTRYIVSVEYLQR